MGEGTPKYKVALDALLVVENYVSSIKAESSRDFCKHLQAERRAKELLNQSSFPNEVKRAVDRVILAVLERNIATIRILEEENRRRVELLEEENKRKIESIEAENKRKRELFWRRIGQGFILVLYLLVMIGAYWKENWTLIFLCVPISFVEKILLDDAFALRLWAWALAKTKGGEN